METTLIALVQASPSALIRVVQRDAPTPTCETALIPFSHGGMRGPRTGLTAAVNHADRHARNGKRHDCRGEPS